MDEPMLVKSKAHVDGRCLDLLLTEEELINAHNRALENIKEFGDECSSCWPSVREECGFWDRLMNKCDCSKKKN